MFWPIIKKYWREIVMAVMAIIIAISVKTCESKRSDSELLKNTLDSTYLITNYYKNKNGEFIGQVKAQQVTISQLENYANELGIDKEKMKDQIGSLENLVTYWKGKASSSGSTVITMRDTVYVDIGTGMKVDKEFTWTNKYLFLDGKMDMMTNKLSLDYKYNVEFEFTSYYKPRTFGEKITFKPKVLVGDLKINDPSARVNEFRGVVIQEEKNKGKSNLISGAVGFLAGFLLGSR
jgi:hypothetical protein